MFLKFTITQAEEKIFTLSFRTIKATKLFVSSSAVCTLALFYCYAQNPFRFFSHIKIW